MGYRGHVCSDGGNWSLDVLDKLQRQVCRNIGPTLATSLKPLAHRQRVACLNPFYRFYFSRYSSVLVKLVPVP